MKQLKNITIKAISTLICDSCGKQATIDDFSFHEFISINHHCGYGSIHGDGNQLNVDLCQQCFADMCGDTLTITDPLDNSGIDDSHISISSRDILRAPKISTDAELQIALKRVEQLWDAQYHSAEGNELHKLANLICCYEKKDWDSYFEQEQTVSDDFMRERDNHLVPPNKKMGKAHGVLSDVQTNTDLSDDDSCQSAITDDDET